MIYLTLFLEFVKIGLFSVGGGLATLPYLYELTDKYDWFTKTELIDMIAISESTPGPLGVNMATFAGYQAGGVLGGIVATMGIVVPALIIITIIAKVLEKFKDNKMVNDAFYGIRPAVTALILSSAWGVVQNTLFHMEETNILNMINWYAIIAFGIILVCIMKFKKHPITYIAIAAVLGIFIPF